MESGKETTEISILGNGIKIKPTATVYMSGKTVTDTKVSGSFALGTVRVQIFLKMVTCISENITTVKLTVMANTVGLTVIHIRARLRME